VHNTEFLKRLEQALLKHGLSKDAVEQAVSNFSEYLSTLSPEAQEKEMNELTDVERAARVILAKYTAQTADADNAPSHSARETEDMADDISVSSDTVKIHVVPPRNRSTAKRGEDTVQTAAIPVVPSQPASAPQTPSQRPSQSVALHTSRAIKYADLDQVVAVDPRNRIIFWCVFALLSPILLGIVLLVVSVFLTVFLGLATVIAGCVVGLVGIVGVGTGITLFGLIYGTIQLLEAVPAGLYELGIAVTVAGTSLLSGIVLYNIAIRLVPLLMKYLYELFRFVMRKGYQLFQFVRRECTGR